jgi:hypothetical protein
MRIYRGQRLPSGMALVSVDDNGTALVPESGDPRFEWGSSGSGAVALARTILAVHLGARPTRGVAHRFAFLTVATWTEDRWLLTSTEIDERLARVRASLQIQCLLCGDTGRREVAAGLWRTCECRQVSPPTDPA